MNTELCKFDSLKILSCKCGHLREDHYGDVCAFHLRNNINFIRAGRIRKILIKFVHYFIDKTKPCMCMRYIYKK
jgi:hypothetical protein